MPLLFSLAIHNARVALKAQLIEVFLDDVYVVAQPAKIPFHNLLGNQVARRDKYPVARRSKLERGIVDDCARTVGARAVGRGGEVVERHLLGSSFPVRVANPRQMRGKPLPLFFCAR